MPFAMLLKRLYRRWTACCKICFAQIDVSLLDGLFVPKLHPWKRDAALPYLASCIELLLKLPPLRFWQWVAEDRRNMRRSARHTHNMLLRFQEVQVQTVHV